MYDPREGDTSPSNPLSSLVLIIGSAPVASQSGAGDWNRTSDLRFEIPRIQPQYNLIPQETTKQDAPDMGLDGAELSCPGSSVVAKSQGEAARFEITPNPRDYRS